MIIKVRGLFILQRTPESMIDFGYMKRGFFLKRIFNISNKIKSFRPKMLHIVK